MRFEELLPWGHTLAYGLDLAVGEEWFGELIDARSEQVLSSYDLLSTAYNRAQPIRGLLLWIGSAAEHYGQEELDQCLATVLADGEPWSAPDCFGFVLHVMGNLAIAARCLARG